MKGIKQPSLLDLGEPKIDLDFPGIVLIDLGEGAWVEHLPNWLKGHQDLFKTTNLAKHKARPQLQQSTTALKDK